MSSSELTVRPVRGSAKGSTEATFEKRVADALKKLGLYTHHVAERYQAGIPDRYVVGGNWIEFKVLNVSETRAVNALRGFSEQQKMMLRQLHAAGDRSWACVGFHGKGNRTWAVLSPWHDFKDHGPWTLEQVESSGVLVGPELQSYLARFFGREYERYSNEAIYDPDQN